MQGACNVGGGCNLQGSQIPLGSCDSHGFAANAQPGMGIGTSGGIGAVPNGQNNVVYDSNVVNPNAPMTVPFAGNSGVAMQHSQPVTNNNGSVYYSPTSPNLTPGAPVPLNNAVPFNPGANAVGSELTPSPLSPNQLPLPASNSMPTLMFQPNGTAGPTSTQNDGTQQQISFRQQSMVQQAPLTRQPFQQYRNGPQTIAAGASMPSGFPVPDGSRRPRRAMTPG